MKKILASLALLVMSLSMAIIAVELSLSLATSDDVQYKYCVGPEKRSRTHDVYGWTEIPFARYFEKKSNADGWASHTYNEYGFRDTYDSGEKHILVLGDSLARGTLADDDSTFPYLLDLWTPETAFHNLSAGGWGTLQELSAYRTLGRSWPHEWVILAFFSGNDVEDNLRWIDARNNGPSFSRLPLLRQIALFGQRTVPNTLKLIYTVAEKTGLHDGPASSSPAELKERLQPTIDLIVELRREAEANGANLLVAIIPESGEINPEKRISLHDARYWRAIRASLFSLRGDTLFVHDLAPELRKARETGQNVYGIGNYHLNEYGYYLVAKSLLKKLKRLGALEPTATAGKFRNTTDYAHLSFDQLQCN